MSFIKKNGIKLNYIALFLTVSIITVIIFQAPYFHFDGDDQFFQTILFGQPVITNLPSVFRFFPVSGWEMTWMAKVFGNNPKFYLIYDLVKYFLGGFLLIQFFKLIKLSNFQIFLGIIFYILSAGRIYALLYHVAPENLMIIFILLGLIFLHKFNESASVISFIGLCICLNFAIYSKEPLAPAFISVVILLIILKKLNFINFKIKSHVFFALIPTLLVWCFFIIKTLLSYKKYKSENQNNQMYTEISSKSLFNIKEYIIDIKSQLIVEPVLFLFAALILFFITLKTIRKQKIDIGLKEFSALTGLFYSAAIFALHLRNPYFFLPGFIMLIPFAVDLLTKFWLRNIFYKLIIFFFMFLLLATSIPYSVYRISYVQNFKKSNNDVINYLSKTIDKNNKTKIIVIDSKYEQLDSNIIILTGWATDNIKKRLLLNGVNKDKFEVVDSRDENKNVNKGNYDNVLFIDTPYSLYINRLKKNLMDKNYSYQTKNTLINQFDIISIIKRKLGRTLTSHHSVDYRIWEK